MPSTHHKRGTAGRIATMALACCALLAAGSPTARAQEEVDGQAVFLSSCAACHQADGRGLPGTFPPLADNPRIDDAAYVADVIQNGRSGEIEVAGTVYDGQMPAVNLSAAERDAVIAYIQGGFADVSQPSALAPLEESERFPWGTLFLFASVVIVVGGIAYFAYPADPSPMTWRRGWALGLVITLYFVLATVWLPSHLLDDPAFASWPAIARDVGASMVWILAIGAGVVGLRWAQRAGRL
jgi:mono/diheme cytochrome c family protein